MTVQAPDRPVVNALLDHGSIHTSPGGQYSFRVIGPCCRLYDREELPWPCCRLAWRSQEPSWKRIGHRFVADLAARKCPSYAVELLQSGTRPTVTVLTLFSQRFEDGLQEWWYSSKPGSMSPENFSPPVLADAERAAQVKAAQVKAVQVKAVEVKSAQVKSVEVKAVPEGSVNP